MNKNMSNILHAVCFQHEVRYSNNISTSTSSSATVNNYCGSEEQCVNSTFVCSVWNLLRNHIKKLQHTTFQTRICTETIFKKKCQISVGSYLFGDMSIHTLPHTFVLISLHTSPLATPFQAQHTGHMLEPEVSLRQVAETRTKDYFSAKKSGVFSIKRELIKAS